ncbi:MAG: pseudouridine synthase [Lachnospiraceae bacterium]
MALIRLDKYLAEMGIGTRTQVKQYLKQGLVCVDGEVEKRPERKIDYDKQHVTYQGNEVGYVAFEYIMLNKPQGVVSATVDVHDRTVLDCIQNAKRKDLFPVGRLDKDTEGLLLLTNDGELAHNLLSPSKHVDKRYFARIEGILPEDAVARFREGLDIGEKNKTKPATLLLHDNNEVEVIISEGKFHQVKRMFEAVGTKVVYLKRLQMGSLKLDENLLPGESRALTSEELERLR